jgi:hypothetical protein
MPELIARLEVCVMPNRQQPVLVERATPYTMKELMMDAKAMTTSFEEFNPYYCDIRCLH